MRRSMPAASARSSSRRRCVKKTAPADHLNAERSIPCPQAQSAVSAVEHDGNFSEELKARVREVRRGAHLNSAACHLKLGQDQDAISATSKVCLGALKKKSLFVKLCRTPSPLLRIAQRPLLLCDCKWLPSACNPRPVSAPHGGNSMRQPVALCRLRTDSSECHFWFDMCAERTSCICGPFNSCTGAGEGRR